MPKLKRESFKSRLAKTPLLGTFVKMSSPEIIEILGFAGFHFVIADMEHTSMDLAVVEQIARVADVHGMDVIVRVPDLSPHYISRALDVGVSGIQVPQIENDSQLEAIVQRAKYPPLGKRGLTYVHRAAEYGFADTTSYMERGLRGDDMAKSTHRSRRAIPDVGHRCKGLGTLTTVRVVILRYQIDDPKWEYAAVIVNKGSVQAVYVTFDVTDMVRNPLFALKFMQRFECEYPTMEMAKQAITQSQCFKPVSDHDLLERLKIDLIR